MHFGIRGSRAPIVRRYLLASPTMNSGMLDVLRIIFHGGTLCQGLISISISTSSANDPLQKVVKRHNSLRFSRNVSGRAAHWSLGQLPISRFTGNWPILSGQARCFVSLRMPSAGGHQLLDGCDGLDATAGADGGAVERGRGAGEIELPLQGPALQEPVDEARVKNVSGAGSVNRLHAKSGGVVELRSVPSQYAFFAQCCCGKATAKSFPQRGKGLLQIRFFHQPPRNIPAGDEVVDIL
jgi:hypothetical protein